MANSGLEIKVDLSKLRLIAQQEPRRVDAWLRGVAQAMTDDVKLKFNTGPGGQTYKRKKRYHIASSPGYPPNVDTGTLRASIKWARGAPLSYRISDGVGYGVYLEYGTSRMVARPFMGPVFTDWASKIERDAGENLNLE